MGDGSYRRRSRRHQRTALETSWKFVFSGGVRVPANFLTLDLVSRVDRRITGWSKARAPAPKKPTTLAELKRRMIRVAREKRDHEGS
jgi:hypothetical protein